MVSSKIIALFTLKYEFIVIFHEIGKNSEVGGRPEYPTRYHWNRMCFGNVLPVASAILLSERGR